MHVAAVFIQNIVELQNRQKPLFWINRRDTQKYLYTKLRVCLIGTNFVFGKLGRLGIHICFSYNSENGIFGRSGRLSEPSACLSRRFHRLQRNRCIWWKKNRNLPETFLKFVYVWVSPFASCWVYYFWNSAGSQGSIKYTLHISYFSLYRLVTHFDFTVIYSSEYET